MFDVSRQTLRVYDDPHNGEYRERLVQDGILELLGTAIPVADLLKLMSERETIA